MNKFDLNSIKYLIVLINNFNKNVDIKYINRDVDSLEDFLHKNDEFILETLSFIETYSDIYNKLNKLRLFESSIISKNLYDPKYLELLMESYETNKDNYIINNILYNQRCLIEYKLEECKKYLSKLIRAIMIFDEYINTYDLNVKNNCINKLNMIYEEDDDNNSDGGNLPELVNQFSVVLKNTYGIKKKNIRVRVLKRF